MISQVKQWQQSRLSQYKFCVQTGIACHVFQYWYTRFRQLSEMASPFLVPVSSLWPAGGDKGNLLPDGKRIIFHYVISFDFLKTLTV